MPTPGDDSPENRKKYQLFSNNLMNIKKKKIVIHITTCTPGLSDLPTALCTPAHLFFQNMVYKKVDEI